MDKLWILLICWLCFIGGCTFPQTPTSGGLVTATKQFRPELFQSGARGEIIVFMADNISDDGFFSTNYTNVMAFKNMGSGEVFFVKTLLGENAFDTAMVPIGQYEVVNLFLQYVYTTTEQTGNTTITTTHVISDEHYENGKKIRFSVKPGEVTYIGHFDLIKPENAVNPDGTIPTKTFKISNKSNEISQKQQQEWLKQFGTDYVVRPATVQ